MSQHLACHCCGRIHRLPKLQADQTAACTRCRSALTLHGTARQSASRTAAAALGAFILFWPAILLPILKIERLGMSSQSSVLGGILDLLHHGSWFVGSVLLLFSIIFPLAKIMLLLELSCLQLLGQRHKALTLRLMEHLGKWSMLDVMLLALLVMLVKLGNLVEFHLGPAVFAFVGCVTMSMIASLCFNPHSIWEENE